MTKQKLIYDDFTVKEVSTIEHHKKSWPRLEEHGLILEAWRNRGGLTVIWGLDDGDKAKYRYKGGKWYLEANYINGEEHVKKRVKDAKTEAQWKKEGFVPKRGTKGVIFSHSGRGLRYFTPDQVRQKTDKDIERAKKVAIKKGIETKKKKAYEQAYLAGKEAGLEAGRRKGYIEALKDEVYGTAREWLQCGRKVIDEPKYDVVSGDKKFYEQWGFYYYHILDTVPVSQQEAGRLLADWDRRVLVNGESYCGFKWW